MCGIIGITRKEDDGPIGKHIYDALARLEYRGYDSVGIAVIDQDHIQVKKDKGPITLVGKKLNFESLEGNTAIGHSRWATHGPPSKINAHPHKSMAGDVVVVHNDIIENFIDLRNELIALGYKFISQTDTEVIPHFLSHQLQTGQSMEEAIVELVRRITGTFAIVIAHTLEPEKIYAIKKDNPLVIGQSENIMYCASDVPAFLPWTNKVVTLKDNELAIITPEDYQIISLPSQEPVERNPHEVTWTADAAQKGGFPHHMLKEIHEQPRVIATQLATQQKQFEELGEIITHASKIILVGAGTAYYASLTAFYTFVKMGGPIVVPCIAAEWDTVSDLVDDKTLVIAVSQSGETLDTIKAVKDGKAKGCKLLSVVNVTGSSLTHVSDYVAYIHAGPEIGVAATKTYVSLALALWRIGFNLAKFTGKLNQREMSEFQQALQSISSVVADLIRKYEAKARDLAKWMSTKNSAFYLGRGISYGTALEGALKMKEISYIHAEAYPAGESKHGPIALVEEDYPVIFTIPNDHNRSKMMGSVQEMKARGATVIGIIEEGDDQMKDTLDDYFEIPKGFSRFLSNIAYIIPQQLFAYYTSRNKGHNPDLPKNLAKAVTVE